MTIFFFAYRYQHDFFKRKGGGGADTKDAQLLYSSEIFAEVLDSLKELKGAFDNNEALKALPREKRYMEIFSSENSKKLTNKFLEIAPMFPDCPEKTLICNNFKESMCTIIEDIFMVMTFLNSLPPRDKKIQKVVIEKMGRILEVWGGKDGLHHMSMANSLRMSEYFPTYKTMKTLMKYLIDSSVEINFNKLNLAFEYFPFIRVKFGNKLKSGTVFKNNHLRVKGEDNVICFEKGLSTWCGDMPGRVVFMPIFLKQEEIDKIEKMFNK